MARPKKKPKYDSDALNKDLLSALVESYNTLDGEGKHPSIRTLAKQYNISALKVRKLLITAVARQMDIDFDMPIAKRVQAMYAEGMDVDQIGMELVMNRSTVLSYLPYQKTIYNLEEKSTNADRNHLYLERKKHIALIEKKMNEDFSEKQEEQLKRLVWQGIKKHENFPFTTLEDKRFYYLVRKNEIYIKQERVTIPRLSFDVGVKVVIAMKKRGISLSSPKLLGVKDSEYIYPILKRFGMI